MKKVIAILLSILMVVSLAACGGQSETVGQIEESSTTNEQAETSTPDAEETEPVETGPALLLGDSVFLGSYEQDNDLENGPEPIEWVVIKRSETGYLVISRYVLDFMKYHETEEDVTWETCDIRAWLNGEFYQDCFTDEERERILLTTVDNSEGVFDNFGSYSAECGYKQGKDTEDYIYLLSEQEMLKTIGNEIITNLIFKEPYATTYAYQKCLTWGSGLEIDTQMNDDNGKCSCMTRSLTDNDTCVLNGREEYVDSVYAMARGYQAYLYVYWEEYFGVRPVMWISN